MRNWIVSFTYCWSAGAEHHASVIVQAAFETQALQQANAKLLEREVGARIIRAIAFEFSIPAVSSSIK